MHRGARQRRSVGPLQRQRDGQTKSHEVLNKPRQACCWRFAEFGLSLAHYPVDGGHKKTSSSI
jgi:hypothetical protein